MSTKKATAVFEPLRHPVLKSMDPVEAVKFMRERELYEIELADKDVDGKQVEPASYKVSVDPLLLRSSYAMGAFDEIAPDVGLGELDESHIKRFIQAIAQAGFEKAPDSSLIENTMKGLKTNMKITNPRNRMFQLALDYDKRMSSIGFETFREKNPKKAIKQIIGAVYPMALRTKIMNDLEYSPEIKQDWKKFLSHLAQTAEVVQQGLDSLRLDKELREKNGKKGSKKEQNSNNKKHNKKRYDQDQSSDEDRMKTKEKRKNRNVGIQIVEGSIN